MSFDSMAKDVASTLSGVFGRTFTLERPSERSSQITATIRRDVETLNEEGGVSIVERTARFAVKDLEFTPKRGDTLTDGSDCFVIGRRLQDDGYFMDFEVTT